MALEYAHGAIQWLTSDGSTSLKTVSGLSFQPKVLKFYCSGLHNAADAASEATSGMRCVGFATSASDRRAVASDDIDGAGSMTCSSLYGNGQVVVSFITGVTDGVLDMNAIRSDGFELIVDNPTSVNRTVFWE